MTQLLGVTGAPTACSPALFGRIVTVSSDPDADRQALLDAALFNAPIQPDMVRLAPLYDLLCTAVYPDLSPRPAMTGAGEADPWRGGAGRVVSESAGYGR